MKHNPPSTRHAPAEPQSEQQAETVLGRCIEQLSAADIGDSQWLEACQVLGQMDPEFALLQIEALTDDRYQVCRALAVALSRMGPSVFDDVIAALNHEHPNVRQFAAGLLYGLAQRGGVVIEDAVPALANALRDVDCRVREKAVVTLCFIGCRAGAAAPSLVEALYDSEAFVREWAAHALAAVGAGADAKAALLDALDDEEPTVRQAASIALVSCNDCVI